MIDVTEIAAGIFRLSMWDEDDLLKSGIFFPGTTYNMFLIKARRAAIIQTMYRRTFDRLRKRVASIVDPKELSYIVIPHHEGDSSGAVNEWLRIASNAAPVCSELCASLSLRDFADKDPKIVADGSRESRKGARQDRTAWNSSHRQHARPGRHGTHSRVDSRVP
jgi:flavorubredoxin